MATKISYAKAATELTEEQKQYVALDCEMVMASVDGAAPVHSLAQIAIVDWHGKVIYKTYVVPEGKITDYLTEYSGVTEKDLKGAPPFEEVRSRVLEIIGGKTVVGHGLKSDFKALKIPYNVDLTRNTSLFDKYQKNTINYRTGLPGRGPRRLRNLAKEYLKENIQEGSHDPAIDARAAMLLYQQSRIEMDAVAMMSMMAKFQMAYMSAFEPMATIVPARPPLQATSSVFVPQHAQTGKKRSSRKNRKTRKQRKQRK
jgi:DNA polymerase III alpha subunit (gram-positive type)